MIRKIISIDKEKCNGCGLCVGACHEGAIGMVEGKAELLREDYCDGLGDCLPNCPTGAIRFVEREAAAYNEEAVAAVKRKAAASCVCPGTAAKRMDRECRSSEKNGMVSDVASELSQWPVQIKLVSPTASYFNGAKLLVAADCTAFAYGNFHFPFCTNRVED